MDKAFVVLNALVARPLSLSESVEVTGIPRATCHRLLSALEHHGAVRRNNEGLYCLGPTLLGLGRGAAAGIGKNQNERKNVDAHDETENLQDFHRRSWLKVGEG